MSHESPPLAFVSDLTHCLCCTTAPPAYKADLCIPCELAYACIHDTDTIGRCRNCQQEHVNLYTSDAFSRELTWCLVCTVRNTRRDMEMRRPDFSRRRDIRNIQ